MVENVGYQLQRHFVTIVTDDVITDSANNSSLPNQVCLNRF